MKIVNLDAFLALPAGTVYCKFRPIVFGDLCIKDETTQGSRDWWYVNLMTPIESTDTCDWIDKSEAAMKGQSVALDFDSVMRDGSFDEDQLFAVWNAKDTTRLVNRLMQALENLT